MIGTSNIFGDWEDADKIAEQVTLVRDCFPVNNHTAFLLTHCGNLFAQQRNSLCLDLYEQSTRLWNDPYQKFSTVFRMAVSHIKRLGSDEKQVMYALIKAYDHAKRFGDVTQNSLNHLFCQGIVKNLEALYLLKKKRFQDAGKAIHSAWDLVAEIEPLHLNVSVNITNRYRMQIIENLALYSGLKGNWQKAIEVLKDALVLARKVHSESVNECLSMLGYCLLKFKKTEGAIEVLLEAERLFSDSVTIEKTTQVRKMLAVAFDQIGQNKQSNYWLGKIGEI